MHDEALGRVEGDTGALGNRVRHGHHHELEGARFDPGVVVDTPQISLDTQFIDAASGQLHRQVSAEDGNVDVRQEECQGPDMILVAVSQNHTFDVFPAFEEPVPVGKDQVDSQHVLLGEHQPAVDERDPAVDLDGRAVAPDLTETAQECEGNGHRVCALPIASTSRLAVSGPASVSGSRTPPTLPHSSLSAALTGAGLVSVNSA